MKKRMLNFVHFVLITMLSLLLLSGCGISSTDLEEAKEQAYREGYEDGYYRGSEEQREQDYEDLLMDGRSIRDIEEQVYEEYGMTPSEAFGIIDEYEYDSTHGGYSWSEYKEAIEVMYYTMSIFPQDY